MPYYDHLGVHYYDDDACAGCAAFDICGVFSDLSLDGKDSKWQRKHIVAPGDGKNREGYLECQMFEPYISPQNKPDRNPEFGLRISEQEMM